jgi:hypothetical protein
MWGVLPSIRFHVSVAALKKPDFGTPKMEKHFSWGKQKLASVVFLAIAISISSIFDLFENFQFCNFSFFFFDLFLFF